MINRQEIADELNRELNAICDRYISNSNLFHNAYKKTAERLKSVIKHLESNFKHHQDVNSYYETTLCLVHALQITLAKGSENFQKYLNENIHNKYPDLKEEITNVSKNYTNEIADVVTWLQVKNYASVLYDATGIAPFKERYDILQGNKNSSEIDRQNTTAVDEEKEPEFLQKFRKNN